MRTTNRSRAVEVPTPTDVWERSAPEHTVTWQVVWPRPGALWNGRHGASESAFAPCVARAIPIGAEPAPTNRPHRVHVEAVTISNEGQPDDEREEESLLALLFCMTSPILRSVEPGSGGQSFLSSSTGASDSVAASVVASKVSSPVACTGSAATAVAAAADLGLPGTW